MFTTIINMLPWTHLSPHTKQRLDCFCTAPYTLQWAAAFPLKIAPCHGGPGPPSTICFFGPTRVHNPNGIPISSTVSVGLMHGAALAMRHRLWSFICGLNGFWKGDEHPAYTPLRSMAPFTFTIQPSVAKH